MKQFNYFCSPIYKSNVVEHLDIVRQVAEENILDSRLSGVDDVYPVTMSNNFNNDPRVLDFGNYIAQAAWDVLNSQGYAMNNFTTHVGEMWMQEHNRRSSMEQHIHKGYHIVGFYFLDTPENCSKAVFYDPRPSKVITDLPEKDTTQVTMASEMINFEVNVGDLILTNAWLPHSFTRNASDKPLRFVHFNIFVQPAQNQPHECEIV